MSESVWYPTTVTYGQLTPDLRRQVACAARKFKIMINLTANTTYEEWTEALHDRLGY